MSTNKALVLKLRIIDLIVSHSRAFSLYCSGYAAICYAKLGDSYRT